MGQVSSKGAPAAVRTRASSPVPGDASPAPDKWDEEYGSPALRLLCNSIRNDGAEDMLKAGKRAMVLSGAGTVMYIPGEVFTLAWASKKFASRVESLNEAPSTNFATAFVPDPMDDPPIFSACFKTGPQVAPKGSSGEKPRLRLTMASAKRVENALRDALERGDGDSLAGIAAKVLETWGSYHKNLPDLRALTWACKVLGARCANGDFGSRRTPEEEAFVQKLTEIVERTYQLQAGAERTAMPAWHEQLIQALDEAKASPASGRTATPN